MKLADLVSIFRRGETFQGFCEANSLDPESEAVEIYAKCPVSVESELGFFPIEEAEGKIHFESDGVQYSNLFDFFYFLEAIEEIKESHKMSDLEIAKRLFCYAINDE